MISCDSSATPAPTIFVRHAYLAFRNVVLFDDLNLTFAAGKWTCLLGPSGIGKSSLLRLLANLVIPDIRADISCDNAIPLSQQIAYMAQTDLLLPWLSVLDNVLLGTRLRHHSNDNIKDKAKSLL